MNNAARVLQAPEPDGGFGHRLISAGAEDMLERFSDPKLLAAGKANVISLEAVQNRFGARWELRRDQVYSFTERVLERGVGDSGFFVRVSPSDFVLVHPDISSSAGYAACLRYLREVMIHFLGEDEMASMGVQRITKITKGRLETQVVDTDPQAERGDIDPATPDPSDDVAPEPRRALEQWSPFVAADGRQLRVSATLEPVYELRGFTRIGFRMIRRVSLVRTGDELTPQQISMLSTGDLLRVDLATMSRGIDRMKTESRGEQQLSLIIPLSFASLSNLAGRAEIVKQLKQAQSLVKLGVICEICDIDGVPPGALLAATSLLRPYALLIVGKLTATSPAAITRLIGTGLQATSFDCPEGLGEAAFIGWANLAITAAKRVAKSVLIYRAGTAKLAGALASLGASHVTVLPL